MKLAIAIVSVALSAVLVACGEDKPAVCGSVDSLNRSVETVKAIPLYLSSSPGEVQRALPSVESDLADVKANARSEFSSQIDAVESDFASLQTSVEAAKSDPSPGTLAAAGHALSTFETDVARLIGDIQATC